MKEERMLLKVVLAVAFMIYTAVALSISDHTQVFQESKSEDDSIKNVNCVASGENLYEIFVRRGMSSGNYRYQFDVHRPAKHYYLDYTAFTVVFNITSLRLIQAVKDANTSIPYTPPDTSSDRCCSPYNDDRHDCYVVQTTRESVYEVLPSPLVYLLAMPLFTLFWTSSDENHLPQSISGSVFIGCWTTPPFCATHQGVHELLKDFTTTLIQKRYDTEINIETLTGTHVQSWDKGVTKGNTISSSIIYSLSVLASLLTLPPALMVLKWYKPSTNRPVPTLWIATQINSWIQFSVYIANYQASFNMYHAYLAEAPQEVKPLLLPYATTGNYFVIALGVIFALELPFVMWYIIRKVLNKAGSGRNTCCLCCKLMTRSVGLTGIVFFLQIVGGWSVYVLFTIFASPLPTLDAVALHTLCAALFVAFTALLLHPCIEGSTVGKCFRGCGVLLYIFILVLTVTVLLSCLLVAVSADNLTAPLNSNQIATSIMSSCLFALIAYIAKKTLWHHLWLPQNLEREDEDIPLLDLQSNVE